MKRRDEIKQSMSGGTEAPPKRRREIKGAMGVGSASQAGLGGQLSRRVSSGALTQKQAERTAGQRSTLKQAYGDDWRKQVYGAEAGQLGALRKAASEGDLGSKMELGTLREKRQRLLKKARKMKSGIGQGQELTGRKYL